MMENINSGITIKSYETVVYDVIEIEDTDSNETIDKNDSKASVEAESTGNSCIFLKNGKHVEVYINSVTSKVHSVQNDIYLQYVCSICNFNQAFFEEILDHFEDKCDNYVEKFTMSREGQLKLGDIYIENKWKMKYVCTLCCKTLFDTQIFVHLSSHLNEFKKKYNSNLKKDCNKIDSNIINNPHKKVMNIYLGKTTDQRFLYCCASCNNKCRTFQSIFHHLRNKAETCGSPTNRTKLKTNQETSLEKIYVKVCEVYMNIEKKFTYICLYCSKKYPTMQLISEHLVIHINQEILYRASNFADTGLKIVKTQSLANRSNENATFKCRICEKIFKFKCSLLCHLQIRHSDQSSQVEELIGQNLDLNPGAKNEVSRTDTPKDSGPGKLLDYVIKPLPNFLPKNSSGEQLQMNINTAYQSYDSVTICNPDEDPNLYISDVDIESHSAVLQYEKNDIEIVTKTNDDSSPNRLLEFCGRPNLLLKVLPVDKPRMNNSLISYKDCSKN